ncbi:MAG: FGGY-family carbohydrate kinase, partial [Bacteroidota bacterium]
GGSDGVLANLGSGILEPGVFALSVGTSGAVRTTHQQADIDPNLGLFNYKLYGNHYVIGGATNNGGKVLAYWQDLLRSHFPDMAAFMRAALSVPERDAPNFAPWLYGERAPLWDAAATAALTGLRGHHGPEHLAAAVVHGVTNNIVTIIRNLEAAVGKARQIQVTGGITKSPQWLELLAQKCAREVVETEVPQATAYGAALVAMGKLEELS